MAAQVACTVVVPVSGLVVLPALPRSNAPIVRSARGAWFTLTVAASVTIFESVFPIRNQRLSCAVAAPGIAGVLTALLLAVSALASSAHAHVIANWDKSSRSWNNAHMTKIKAAMEAAGHQVLPDSSDHRKAC